ncbi:hypothetical protein TNIN_114831 [Trichonephila inaurata madagascariensis]|uniref:Uncharacterized protein n=1 Tax=Trichonephila inaurata madagascariensis TaxID=2747483 RepID=A0A8X6YKB0_9ARAC|nr:hypothetical protein TNIN_114831 [Trichonephila inaurata madagascariensis]
MAKATIPVTTPIKEEKGIDDLRDVYVKVKDEQEMVNAVIGTGAQIPVVRADIVEGQNIDNRGTIQITSAFGEHEMGELKGSSMEINDLRHSVVPISKIRLTTDSKSFWSQEVVPDLHPETYPTDVMPVPNESLGAVEIDAWNVQTNGQDIKESKRKVTLSVDSLDSENNFILSGSVVECWKSNVITLLNNSDEHVNNVSNF